MRFRAVHKLMSYLLAAAAVGTLMTTGSVPLPTLALLGGLGVLSWFVEPGTPFGRLLDRAGLVFNVVALAFFGLSLFQVIESFPEPELTPILNVVLFLLGYKLFHRRNNRDYLQIYVLSFLLILASAWLAQTIFFVVGFVAYVVLATWTLILFHLRREIEDNYLVKHLPESGSEKVTAARVLNSRRVVGRSFFVATGVMSLAVFLGAAVVFAVIPRVGIGFLSGTFRRRVNIVGFSDEVTLGHHGVISGDNQTVVLWVRLPRLEQVRGDDQLDRAISQLYWRGTIYDTYLNGQWIRSRRPETATVLDNVPASDGGRLYWLRSPEAPPRERRYSEQQLAALDEQEIHVVGLSHPVAFALDEPVVFRAPVPPPGSFVSVGMQPRFGGEVGLRLERSMGLPGSSVKEFSGARYLAYSRQLYGRMPFGFGRPTAELQAQGLLSSYLTVPRSMSPRVGELARTITEGKIGPMAKALAIVEWLQKTHQYTTDLRRNSSVADPLEDFLFHQSAGHCEYFASATAVLLRLAGVPSRYVNGFLGGEWNDLGKYLTIRDNRAHSWAEAYLGPAGWVRIDATPMANTGSHMGRLRQLVDSIEFFWSRWVIDYDVSRQIDIAKRIGRGVGVAKSSVDFAHLKRVLRWGALGLLAGTVLVVVVRRLRARRWGPVQRGTRAHGRRSGPRIYRLYETVLARLARRGWTRGSAETPREFASRLTAAQVPAASALQKLTEHYGAARFGDREIPDDLVSQLERAADELGRGTPPPPVPPPPGGAAQPTSGRSGPSAPSGP
jgi:protein-glutamine gamma-glutamyltransferase